MNLDVSTNFKPLIIQTGWSIRSIHRRSSRLSPRYHQDQDPVPRLQTPLHKYLNQGNRKIPISRSIPRHRQRNPSHHTLLSVFQSPFQKHHLPTQAGAFFTTYEGTKIVLTQHTPLPTPITHGLASSAGELVSCFILTPAEVLKQNAQMVTQSLLNIQ